jgi:ferritin-like metal-binding protein YciE
MTVKNPKELFVLMLSDVQHGAEITNKFFRELVKLPQDTDVKEAIEARIFVSDQGLETLNKCFELIGEKPAPAVGQLYDNFVESFRKQLSEIQNPPAKRLFVLSRITAMIHLAIGEYVALIAAADWTGHYNIGVLLESCLADNLAFIERTRRLILEQVRERATAKP